MNPNNEPTPPPDAAAVLCQRLEWIAEFMEDQGIGVGDECDAPEIRAAAALLRHQQSELVALRAQTDPVDREVEIQRRIEIACKGYEQAREFDLKACERLGEINNRLKQEIRELRAQRDAAVAACQSVVKALLRRANGDDSGYEGYLTDDEAALLAAIRDGGTP